MTNQKYNITIDPEFETLIPPLSDEEFNQLKDNVLEAGECHDPILIWNNLIVDGHNRWKIIQENQEVAYQVREMIFLSRNDAMAWMIRNQLGRRNLTAFTRTELSLKLKPLLAEEAKKRQGERNDLKDIPQKSAGSEVRDEIAKAANVSHDTVSKVERIIEKAPEEVKSITNLAPIVAAAFCAIVCNVNEDGLNDFFRVVNSISNYDPKMSAGSALRNYLMMDFRSRNWMDNRDLFNLTTVAIRDAMQGIPRNRKYRKQQKPVFYEYVRANVLEKYHSYA